MEARDARVPNLLHTVHHEMDSVFRSHHVRIQICAVASYTRTTHPRETKIPMSRLLPKEW